MSDKKSDTKMDAASKRSTARNPKIVRSDYHGRMTQSTELARAKSASETELRGKTRSDTRIRLLAAAIEMFANRGFESTTMRDLATRVGIRAPAIYNHYKSKEEILGAALTWAMEDFNTEVIDPDQPNDPPAVRLRSMLRRHISYQLNNPEIARAYDMLLTTGMLDRVAQSDGKRLVLERMRKYVKAISNLVTDLPNASKKRASNTVLTHAILTMYDQIGRWYRPNGAISEENLEENFWQLVASMTRLRQ